MACRDSLCRVETTHASEEAFHAFIEGALAAPQDRVWDGAFFTHATAGPSSGQVSGVTYLVRDGRSVSFERD